MHGRRRRHPARPADARDGHPAAGLHRDDGDDDLAHLLLHRRRLPHLGHLTPLDDSHLLTPSSSHLLPPSPTFPPKGITPLDYSLAFGAITFAGAYAGKRSVAILLHKYRCVSLIVLTLGALIGLSALGIATTGAVKLQAQLTAGPSYIFYIYLI